MGHEAKLSDQEVTPDMIEAGEKAILAFGVTPPLSTSGWASDLASAVYRAMERARLPKHDR